MPTKLCIIVVTALCILYCITLSVTLRHGEMAALANEWVQWPHGERQNWDLLFWICCKGVSRLPKDMDSKNWWTTAGHMRWWEQEDIFAVALTKDDATVGYVPREQSRILWHFLSQWKTTRRSNWWVQAIAFAPRRTGDSMYIYGGRSLETCTTSARAY